MGPLHVLHPTEELASLEIDLKSCKLHRMKTVYGPQTNSIELCEDFGKPSKPNTQHDLKEIIQTIKLSLTEPNTETDKRDNTPLLPIAKSEQNMDQKPQDDTPKSRLIVKSVGHTVIDFFKTIHQQENSHRHFFPSLLLEYF